MSDELQAKEEAGMKTYKNTKAPKGSCDFTVIRFAQGFVSPGEQWIECDASEIGRCTKIRREGFTQFYGDL